MLTNRIKAKYVGLAIAVALAMLLALKPAALLWNVDLLIAHFQGMGAWGVVLFLLAHLIATVLGFPGTVLVIAGGAVFGLVWGTFWSVIGATAGAIAAFSLARSLLREWVQQRVGHCQTMIWVNQLSDRQALACVLAVRFTPISPFNLANFLFGLTSIPLQPYVLGTFVGIIPGTLLYTWIGVAGERALHGDSLLPLLTALSGLAMLSVLPLGLQKWRRK